MDRSPPGLPGLPRPPMNPTIQGTSNFTNTQNSPITPSTIDHFFGPSQAYITCSNCRNPLGQSIMLKDFKNNILCEVCYKLIMICSKGCGNLACAYLEISSEMFCFDCSIKVNQSQLKTFINIIDNSEYANLGSIILRIDRKNMLPLHQELINLYNNKSDIELEHLMEQVVNLCKGYKGSTINLVLIKYLLLLDKDQEALQLVSEIKDQKLFSHAASLFLDLCSVENLIDPNFKTKILGFNEENTSIISKRLKIYKEGLVNPTYLSSIIYNLNIFPVYLGFKKDVLLTELENRNYTGFESYARYLDILLPPSIYKTKCLRSIASLALKSYKYELSSIIGERAIISHLINKKNVYTDMTQLAFIVAKSKIHSGKDAGVLNLLALVYENSEKLNDIPMMIESCDLAKEFYKRTDPKIAERVQEKMDFLKSTPRKA